MNARKTIQTEKRILIELSFATPLEHGPFLLIRIDIIRNMWQLLFKALICIFLDPVGLSMIEDSNNVTKADAGAFSDIYIFCVIFALQGPP